MKQNKGEDNHEKQSTKSAADSICWYLSKEKPVWMTVALVMFIIDTVAMVALFIWAEDSSGVLDAVIHVCVLYYLFMGVKNANLLKKLPEEQPNPVNGFDGYEQQFAQTENDPFSQTNIEQRILK